MPDRITSDFYDTDDCQAKERATSIQISKFPGIQASTAVQVLNQLRFDLLKLANGSIYHASPSPKIPQYVSGNFGLNEDMLNLMTSAFNNHITNVCDSETGLGCHLVADYENDVSVPLAVDLASSIRKANELKRKFNLHIASSEFHAIEDVNNVVTKVDAKDYASLRELVQELRDKMNAHFSGAFTTPHIQVI